MKKFFMVGVVAVIGALALASAASLTVNGGSVQAGSDTCVGLDLSVELTQGGTSVSSGGPQSIAGTLETVPVSAVDAATVDDVHVAIH